MSESVSRLATDLGGDLLRVNLLDAPRPVLDNRYTIEKVLGRGATGVVVRAHDQRLARDVAIKLAPTDAVSRAVLDEARALAQLKRPPNVVQVWEVTSGSLSGSSNRDALYYIVMELVVGVTLREWRNARVPTQAEVLRIYADLAVGLSHVHAANLVHGDFKPDNVIVDKHGVPTLVDFGFAARVRRESGGARRGEVVGTPPYMAPEAYVGQLRRRSDVHAFAVSLWESLTGVLPFTGKQAPKGWFGVSKLPREETVPLLLRTALKSAMDPSASSRPHIAALHPHVARAIHVVSKKPRRWWWRLQVAVLLLASFSFAMRHADWVRPISPGTADFLERTREAIWEATRPFRESRQAAADASLPAPSPADTTTQLPGTSSACAALPSSWTLHLDETGTGREAQRARTLTLDLQHLGECWFEAHLGQQPFVDTLILQPGDDPRDLVGEGSIVTRRNGATLTIQLTLGFRDRTVRGWLGMVGRDGRPQRAQVFGRPR